MGAKAQCGPASSPPGAPARAIVGLVTDSARHPITDARISLREPRRETLTDLSGRFEITGLPRGEYELLIRKIGFELERATAVVGDSGAVVRVCMAVATRPHPALVSSASRNGLGGVVADASHRPVAGAEVRIVGNGSRANTDSTGAFFLPLRKGHYAVMVSMPGYGTQMLGVTIPADSGREIAVWLGAPPLNKNRYAAELDDMRWRSVLLPGSRYAVRTAEDIASSNLDVGQQILAAAKTATICNGGIRAMGQDYPIPADMIEKTEIAMIEVVTVVHGKPGQRGAPPCASAVIWFR
jgi:hypothetical protein